MLLTTFQLRRVLRLILQELTEAGCISQLVAPMAARLIAVPHVVSLATSELLYIYLNLSCASRTPEAET